MLWLLNREHNVRGKMEWRGEADLIILYVRASYNKHKAHQLTMEVSHLF